jgi:hypothetical protein
LIHENGRPSEAFWRIDLFAFQSVFLLDIILRLFSLRRRLPGLSWRDALLRLWTDLPLLLPFWRLSRVIPVAARLHSSGLVDAEPVRAVLSSGAEQGSSGPIGGGADRSDCSAAARWPAGFDSLPEAGWPLASPTSLGAGLSAARSSRRADEVAADLGPVAVGQGDSKLGTRIATVVGPHPATQPGGNGFPCGLAAAQAAVVVDGLLDLSKGTAQELLRKDKQGTDLLASTA